ncbi:MAG: hypothetical protein FJ213_07890 [Ignavibacteria bacterium]|nr:hypothetical protein [Ignavibacteria bacterium]
MKKKTLTIIFLILIIEISFAQRVEVKDYQVPISRAQILRTSAFWNWGQIGDSVSTNSATADLIFRKFYSSLPFAWFLDADVSGGKAFSKYSHDINIKASARKYIWEERDLFAFTEINARHIDYYKQISSSLTFGAGYGRYIDATALAKAVRIEEHLIKESVIKGHLPKNTMVKIANIIEREPEYEDIYSDTYETFWFFDIENEIKASDMLIGNNLGAIGILRMRQVLFGINERVNNRYYGWDVTFGTRFDLTRFDKGKIGSPNLNLAGRYSYPLGWKFQINTIGEIYSPLDSLFAKQITSNIGFDFIYELSNRINLVTSYKLGLQKPSSGTTEATNIFNTAFLFYLENEIYFGINGSLQRIGNRPRVIGLSMTLQYNLF